MSKSRDWFELARIPNVFTAVADPLAGALIVGATWRHLPGICVVMLVSAMMYTAGVVLNDLADFKRDRLERPERPLPSGRIRRSHALLAVLGLLLAGLMLSSAAGPETIQVAALILVAIVLYDVLLKDIPIAPVFMASCRSLNLLLGMTLVPSEAFGMGLWPRVYLMIAIGLYVLGITVFAMKEALSEELTRRVAASFVTVFGILGVGILKFAFPRYAFYSAGFVWVFPLTAVVVYRMTQAVLTPVPQRVQLAVKTGVLGIIVFDAAMVGFFRDLPATLPVILLLVPAWLLGRKLAVT